MGQQDSVKIPGLEAPQPGIDIATEQLDVEVRPRPQGLGPAAHRSCTEPGAWGKRGERTAFRSDQRIAGVLAFEHCAQA